MLIKKPADISSAEITPKHLYLNRRNFLLGAGALAGAAFASRRIGRCRTVPPKASALPG